MSSTSSVEDQHHFFHASVLDKLKCNVHSFIAKGTFGKVYKCVPSAIVPADDEDNCITAHRVPLALKCYKTRFNCTEIGMCTEFLREVAALQCLHHTWEGKNFSNCVPTVFGVDCNMIAMQYASTDLFTLLHAPCTKDGTKNTATLDDQQTLSIILQMVRAVAFVHEHTGICHRDLKPSNILLHDNTTLKLADWGSVSLRPGLFHAIDGATGGVVTCWYRAPEVCLDNPYGCGVDVFAVGCILHELLQANNNTIPLFDGESNAGRWLQLCRFWKYHTIVQSNTPPSTKAVQKVILNYIKKWPKLRLGGILPRTLCEEEELLHIMVKMLHPNPHQRISMQQAWKKLSLRYNTDNLEQQSQHTEKSHVPSSLVWKKSIKDKEYGIHREIRFMVYMNFCEICLSDPGLPVCVVFSTLQLTDRYMQLEEITTINELQLVLLAAFSLSTTLLCENPFSSTDAYTKFQALNNTPCFGPQEIANMKRLILHVVNFNVGYVPIVHIVMKHIKTVCAVITDRETREWLYPLVTTCTVAQSVDDVETNTRFEQEGTETHLCPPWWVGIVFLWSCWSENNVLWIQDTKLCNTACPHIDDETMVDLLEVVSLFTPNGSTTEDEECGSVPRGGTTVSSLYSALMHTSNLILYDEIDTTTSFMIRVAEYVRCALSTSKTVQMKEL